MNTYDAVVVGGGPIGGFTAAHIAKQGYSVALVEEHKTIGTPLKCAGLITPRVFDLLGINTSNIIQNTIVGAHFHSPSGKVLSIGGDKQQALVINRPLFDQRILKTAQQHGVKVQTGTKVVHASKTKSFVALESIQDTSSVPMKTQLLIGADGPQSKIRSLFGFPQPRELLHGVGAHVENISLDPRYVEVFLGRTIAPGFFGWAIPITRDGTEARIGLCIDPTAPTTIKQCFSKLCSHALLKDVKILKQIGGTIPLGALKTTTQSRIMLVGDAAAQVKPTSGGGVYPGLLCATHCSSVAVEALTQQTCGQKTLKSYHKLWSSHIGKELARGMTFRRIFRKLNDTQLDKYLEILNTEKNIALINEFGDIDYPSKLGFPLLRANPSLMQVLPSALKRKLS